MISKYSKNLFVTQPRDFRNIFKKLQNIYSADQNLTEIRPSYVNFINIKYFTLVLKP